MQREYVLPARSLWGSSAALTALAPLFGAVVVLWKSTVLCPSIEFSCGMESASSRCLSLNKALSFTWVMMATPVLLIRPLPALGWMFICTSLI